jgi:hypothetical protein
MKTRLAVCFAFLLVGTFSSHSAGSLPQSGSEHEKKFGTVTLLRVINTAEMEHYRGQKTYVGFAQLLGSGELDAVGKHYGDAWSKLQLDRTAGAQPLPGWEMHFTVDGNGNSYSVALSEKPNYEAFFTDERGLIYEAKPLQ